MFHAMLMALGRDIRPNFILSTVQAEIDGMCKVRLLGLRVNGTQPTICTFYAQINISSVLHEA